MLAYSKIVIVNLYLKLLSYDAPFTKLWVVYIMKIIF